MQLGYVYGLNAAVVIDLILLIWDLEFQIADLTRKEPNIAHCVVSIQNPIDRDQ